MFEDIVKLIEEELEKQLATLPTADIARQSLQANGIAVIVKGISASLLCFSFSFSFSLSFNISSLLLFLLRPLLASRRFPIPHLFHPNVGHTPTLKFVLKPRKIGPKIR
jgi:hypothetical protein